MWERDLVDELGGDAVHAVVVAGVHCHLREDAVVVGRVEDG